jgi:hypothetical protein
MNPSTALRRTALSAAALIVGLALTPSAARAEDSAITAILASPDTPADAATLRAAGVDPSGKALLAIVDDARVTRYVRARAASALGGFEGAEPELRRRVQARATTDVEVFTQLVDAYAHAAGARGQPLLVETFTKSPERAVRIAAGLGLVRLGARDALLASEKDRVVVQVVRRTLARAARSR